MMFPYLAGGPDDFVDRVVPELQQRPENRFFAAGDLAASPAGQPRRNGSKLSKGLLSN